mgnify:CR=1 FL=1
MGGIKEGRKRGRGRQGERGQVEREGGGQRGKEGGVKGGGRMGEEGPRAFLGKREKTTGRGREGRHGVREGGRTASEREGGTA